MTWLLITGLTNAVLATALAAGALVVARIVRRPAVVHLLWIVVLVKLLTPPLVQVPVGWTLDGEAWFDESPVAVESRDSTVALQPTAAPPRALGCADTPPATSNDKALAMERPARSEDRADAPLADVCATCSPPVAKDAAGSAPAQAALLLTISPQVVARMGLAIWLGGALLCGLLLAWRVCRFQRFLRLAGSPDARLSRRAAHLAASAGLRSAPEVLVVESVVSPMLWGLGRRTRLIFPAALLETLDGPMCDSLLLHELAHYARKDHWVRLLELAARVVYWWHPVVWWARHEIEAAEEQCCDAWVIERQAGTRRSYAEALLATIDFLCEQPSGAPPAACSLGDVPLLRCRLTQIMRGEVAASVPMGVKAIVVAIALVLLPLGPALWGSSSATIVPPAPELRTTLAPPPSPRSAPSPNSAAAMNEQGAEPLRQDKTNIAPAPVSLEPPKTSRLYWNPASHWATATAPNGRFQLEARTGRKAALVNRETNWRLDLSSYVIDCASFSADSRLLVTGHDDRMVRIWDSATGGLLHTLKGSGAAVTTVHFSPDGQRVAAGAADGGVLVWNLETEDVVARLAPQGASIGCVRWSSHGDRLLVTTGSWSGRDAAELLVWSPSEDAVLARHALNAPAAATEWLGDDRIALVAGWDGQSSLWNLAAGEPTARLQLEKDVVSAANWSADCRLAPRWLVDQFLAQAK